MGFRILKCPFYNNKTYTKIICEGVIPDTIIHNSFNSKDEMSFHYKEFCCGKCENCECYIAINNKYEECI